MAVVEVPLSISDKSARRVRVAFNVSGSDAVTNVKQLCAAAMSSVEHLQSDQSSDEARERARLASLAITHMEIGAMFAVKALTG